MAVVENSVPPLPPLPPDLLWLLSLEPTRAALRAFVRRPSAHALPPGAQTRPFLIANLFSSASDAPERQRVYDLVRPDCLADMVFVPRPLRLSPRAYPFVEVDPCRRQRAAEACADLYAAWRDALMPACAPLSGAAAASARWSLRLTPQFPLPTPALIEELRQTCHLPYLALLAARHELGYLYLKVRYWHQRAVRGYELDPRDVCLDARDAGLLSARIRGFLYWELGPIDSASFDGAAPPLRRYDAPRARLLTGNDLSPLYLSLCEWYQQVYHATVNAPRCAWPDGCTRLRPTYKGKGARPRYCAVHAQESKRRQDAQSKRRGRLFGAAQARRTGEAPAARHG